LIPAQIYPWAPQQVSVVALVELQSSSNFPQTKPQVPPSHTLLVQHSKSLVHDAAPEAQVLVGTWVPQAGQATQVPLTQFPEQQAPPSPQGLPSITHLAVGSTVLIPHTRLPAAPPSAGVLQASPRPAQQSA
jgi:hypothetical protein